MRLVDKFQKSRGITVNDRFQKRSGSGVPAQWLVDVFGGMSVQNTSGQAVNEKTAMSLSPVHACVRVISEGLATMPLKLYVTDGRNKTIDKSSQVARLIEEPNPFSTGVSFRKYMTAVAVLKGNSYAYIFRNKSGQPINLLPLQNCTVEPVLSGGGLYYQITTTDPIYKDIPKIVSYYDMLHFKGLCITNQFTAISPIAYHAQTLGIDLAAMSAIAGAFKTGTKKFMITSDKGWKTDEQKAVKDSFEYVLNNDSLAMAVPSGISAETISLSPSEAGYLEAIGATAKDIARIFGVPASIIGADDGAIKASVEQDSLNFLNQTLNPWAVSIEAELKTKLLSENEKPNKYFKHNFNSLMRADAASRAEFYSKMLNIGAMSPNDIRMYEDMNGYDAGDEYFVNANLVPTDMSRTWTQGRIDAMESQQQQTNNPNGNN